MAEKYETSIFTRQELKSARMKGQVKGWIQGAASTFLLVFLLNFLGWIPAILVLAGIGFVGYKIFKAGKNSAE